jgi:hypothetical protein
MELSCKEFLIFIHKAAHPLRGGPFHRASPNELFANLSAGAKMVLPVDSAAAR